MTEIDHAAHQVILRLTLEQGESEAQGTATRLRA